MTGLGVTQDDAEAIRWYKMAAAQGDPHALTVLKKMGVR